MLKIFNKGTFVMIGLFVLTIVLAVIDPLNLNPDGVDEDTLKPAWYGLPALVFWFFYFAKPTIFGTKELNPEQKRQVLYEQIKSIIRKIGAVIAGFIVAGLSSKIPYLDFVGDIINFIAANFDISVQAIEVLIGVAVGLISQFTDSARFASRTLINPRKINV